MPSAAPNVWTPDSDIPMPPGTGELADWEVQAHAHKAGKALRREVAPDQMTPGNAAALMADIERSAPIIEKKDPEQARRLRQQAAELKQSLERQWPNETSSEYEVRWKKQRGILDKEGKFDPSRQMTPEELKWEGDRGSMTQEDIDARSKRDEAVLGKRHPEAAWLRDRAVEIGKMPMRRREDDPADPKYRATDFDPNSDVVYGRAGTKLFESRVDERVAMLKESFLSKYPDKKWTPEVEKNTRAEVYAAAIAESWAGNRHTATSANAPWDADNIPEELRPLVLLRLKEAAESKGIVSGAGVFGQYQTGVKRGGERGANAFRWALKDWWSGGDTKNDRFAADVVGVREQADPLNDPRASWYKNLPGQIGELTPALVATGAFPGVASTAASFGLPRAQSTYEQKRLEGAGFDESMGSALLAGGTETAVFTLNPFKPIKGIGPGTVKILGGERVLANRLLEIGGNYALGVGKGSLLLMTNEGLISAEKELAKWMAGRGVPDAEKVAKDVLDTGKHSLPLVAALHAMQAPGEIAAPRPDYRASVLEKLDAGKAPSRGEANALGATPEEARSSATRLEWAKGNEMRMRQEAAGEAQKAWAAGNAEQIKGDVKTWLEYDKNNPKFKTYDQYKAWRDSAFAFLEDKLSTADGVDTAESASKLISKVSGKYPEYRDRYNAEQEKTNAQQVTQAAPANAGGEVQPGIRVESGDSAIGGQRVPGSGQVGGEVPGKNGQVETVKAPEQVPVETVVAETPAAPPAEESFAAHLARRSIDENVNVNTLIKEATGEKFTSPKFRELREQVITERNRMQAEAEAKKPESLAKRAAAGEEVARPEGVSEWRWNAMVKQAKKGLPIRSEDVDPAATVAPPRAPETKPVEPVVDGSSPVVRVGPNGDKAEPQYTGYESHSDGGVQINWRDMSRTSGSRSTGQVEGIEMIPGSDVHLEGHGMYEIRTKGGGGNFKLLMPHEDARDIAAKISGNGKPTKSAEPEPPEPPAPPSGQEPEGVWRGRNVRQWRRDELESEAKKYGIQTGGRSKDKILQDAKDAEENIRDHGERIGVHHDMLRDAAERALPIVNEKMRDQRDALRRARDVLGLNPSDIKRLENGSLDRSNVKNFDDAMHSLEMSEPDLFKQGGDPNDIAWEFMRRTMREFRNRRIDDPEVLDEAGDILKSEGGNFRTREKKLDATPEEIAAANAEVSEPPADAEPSGADIASLFRRQESAPVEKPAEPKLKPRTPREEDKARRKAELDELSGQMAEDAATLANILKRFGRHTPAERESPEGSKTGKGSPIPIDDEALGALANLVASAAKFSMKLARDRMLTFGEFVSTLPEKIRENIGEFEPHLKRLWELTRNSYKRHRLAPINERPPVDPEEIDKAPTPDKLTSVKNEVANDLREGRGVPGLESAPAESVQKWLDDATDRWRADPNAPEKLIIESNVDPRPLNDEETMLMQLHYRKLNNDLRDATQAIVNAEGGSDGDKAVAKQVFDGVMDKIETTEQMLRSVGTEWGRAGVARQQMMRFDFTVEAMTARAIRSKGGGLTPEEVQAIQGVADRIEGYREKVERLQSEVAIDRAIRSAGKSIERERRVESAGKARVAASDRAAAALQAFKEKWSALRGEGKFAEPAGKPEQRKSELFDAGVELVKAYLDLGVKHFSEFVSRARADLGEDISESREALREAWLSVVKGDAAPTVKIDPEKPEAIGRLARKLTRAVVEGGITEREKVVDAVHDDLAAVLGKEWTRRQTMDAMSGYGNFRPLKKDFVSRNVRRIAGELQQLAKLDDMLRLRREAKKTGQERREVGAEESELIKLVNEAKKRGGFEKLQDKDAATKSALDAAKTAVQNRIRHLKREIKNKALTVKNKAKLEVDQEYLNMKQELADTQKDWDAIFRKPPTEAERITAAEKSIDKTINELWRQISTGDVALKAKPDPLMSDALEAKRALVKELVKQRKSMRDANLTDAERAVAVERILDRSITEMERQVRELEAGRPIAKKSSPIVTTPEIEAKRAALEELKARKAELTDTPERRDEIAAKAIERIADRMQADLDAGNIWTDSGERVYGPEPASPLLDAARARIEALRANHKALQDKEDPNRIYRLRLAEQLARWKGRIATDDFERAAKPERSVGREEADLLYQIKQEKLKFKKMQEGWERKHWSKIRKIGSVVPDTLNTSRALMTSMDLSAVLRQGNFAVFSHPILAVKALPAMFRAITQRGALAVAEEIRRRENAPLYDRAKLAITISEGKLSAQEEAYMGNMLGKLSGYLGDKGSIVKFGSSPLRWLSHGVEASERTYVTFLNRMRADVFDSMTANLARNGTDLTLDEAKVIANYVNVATGRGGLGKFEAAALPLATVFFSPRYMVSRFQLLGLQPMWRGTLRTRVAVAKEYARYAVGAALFYVTAGLALKASDKKFSLTFDPTSADFGKIVIGNTRLDPLGGLAQTMVLLGRTWYGFSTNAATKEKTYLTGDKVPFGKGNLYDTWTKFARQKFSPWLGAAWDYGTGENVVGEKVKASDIPANLLTPLSLRDVYRVMRDQGVPAGTAMSILSIFGMGMQSYRPKQVAAKERPRRKSPVQKALRR